ncbi:MAG: hypothetical protein GOMPHAMPRED_001766 [Gomphillus americanus]|uniref:CFEM domain-containing protein n=1 Tax=Gomphillus americanus TaxID=1940652 RepID=A0A8H3I914_9LECA|nr:MAG: hypothetical protein GOMPHAMPRED_001766 [Gomphillus americanus]
MQFSLLAFASLLAAVTAQNGVPTCAAGCVRNLPSQCATQDIGCICGDSSFITNVSCCVFKSCPQSDQAAALSFALNICQAGGVSLTNTAATCLSTAATTPSSSTSSTPASTTPAAVGGGSGSTSAMTTAPTSGTTAGAGSGSMSMSSTSDSASAATGSSSMAGSTSPSPSTGAAPKITAMAGFFGAAAAAVALL